MDTHDPNHDKETFLADWLAGKLTDVQLQQRVSAEDFSAYQKLRQSLESLQVSDPDLQNNFDAIKEKRQSKNTVTRKKTIPIYRYSAIAAALFLLIGLYNLFVFSNSVATDYGKTARIQLSDGSQVALNAKSEVSFPTFFKCNRTLKLNGEAFFEVTRGSTFTVKTGHGNVTVLGTKFNVVSRPGYFEVVCLEGKVKVVSSQQSLILAVGEAVRFYGNQSETWTEIYPKHPLWMAGESGFKKAPLFFVLAQLEQQYHYSVQYPKQFAPIKFTGSFPNRDLDTALQSICAPLNLKYKISDRTIILSE